MVVATSQLSAIEGYDTIEHLNILLFGNSGYGKSSLIEAIYNLQFNTSSLKHVKHNNQRIVREEGESNQKTVEFLKYSIENLNVFDTVGWNPSSKTYTADLFRQMVIGSMPIGYKVLQSTTLVPVSGETKFQQKIDIVLFVMDSFISEEHLNKLKEYVDVCVELKIPYLFVITKVDELKGMEDLFDKEIDKARITLNRNTVLTEAKQRIKKVFGNDIPLPLPIINYKVDDSYKNMLITELTRTLLGKSIEAVSSVNKQILKSNATKWGDFDFFKGETEAIAEFVK